ncbi:MAG: PrsW family intramembrane metalloprotease [Lachnospiraceae bacterium]|nr:PrsW family intramembrane metalloprotease [Lachnospiraceae bacterium]
MNYIENIYLCLSMPLLVAALCTTRSRRASLIFMLGGMTACLCSAYISAFFVGIMSADTVAVVSNITPMVEETMKLLPVLFYLLVFEPSREEAGSGILMTAVGFATLENVCYLMTNGASNVIWLLIRGAGSGAMHIVCGMLMGLGLNALWNVAWLKAAGTVAMLGFVIIYHAIYNLLVSQQGLAAVVGYLLPLLTVIFLLPLGRRFRQRL